MMEDVAVPPFERLYRTHSGEILAYLRRTAAPGEAEDAFQETFLRALRAYDRLASAQNLRAWLFTIATRVVVDAKRRTKPVSVPMLEPAADFERPAYAQIEHLTAELPPTERAAVVLRYGYDFAYADIAAALGSSEEAARQAASSGVRRLRGRNR
jgi:RNA polymerase sigma factor (sigma-70 family)